MDIDYSRELKELFNAWHDCFFTTNPYAKNRIYVFGDDADAIKTVVQQFLHQRKRKTRYFSFACLDNAHALRAFAKAFELETESPETWEEAGRVFQKKYGSETLLVFFDDLEFFSEQDAFRKACFEFIAKKNIIVAETCRCRREDWKPEPMHHFSVFIGCRMLSDLCKLFPDYAKPDIVRLYSMTGGISTILNELDADRSFEDNLRTLLRFDSAFTRYLPEWLRRYFRTPESYYPILCSMARGKRRLSEIAHDVGFPNNKCLNYLQALMRAGLVRTETAIGNRQTAYLLTNSYIAAWCLYVYERRSEMISDPDAFLQVVPSEVDEKLAVPTFRRACYRFLENGTKEYLDPFAGQIFSSTNPEVYRDVIIELGDGSSVLLDYCTQKDDHSLVAVIPDSLDRRFTKDDIENIRYAVKLFDKLYDTEIVIFSVSRFSDWCVHEASKDCYLHLVTAERLKY